MTKYDGVVYNSSKDRYIGRAVIDGKRKELCSDKDETQCAIKRNQKLIELLGAEDAAPLLNDIDPSDDVRAEGGAPEDHDAPAQPEEAQVEQPAQGDDMPFNVTEQQIDAAVAQAPQGAALDIDADPLLTAEDDRPKPFPDSLGADLIIELESAGFANLRDTVNVSDERLFKLRAMTGRKLNDLRDAEAAAGLREPEPQEEPAPTPAKGKKGAAKTDPAADAMKSTAARLLPDAPEVIAPMTDSEREDFTKLKGEARDSAVKLWRALKEISDRKLYREHFPSFEKFVESEFDGKGRQWAYQLIDAANTADKLAVIDVQPATERQARDLKKTAKTVAKMTPENQQIVAQVVKGLTGTDKPLTAQVNAVVEVVAALDQAGTVEDPETGVAVKLTDLTPEKRVAVLRENVTTATYERLKRQEGHIAQKGAADKTLNGKGSSSSSAANVNASSWADWLMNYAAQGLAFEHEVRLTIKKDPSGNPTAVAQVIDTATGAVIAEGEANTRYVKGTVMSLIERLKYGGDVK